MVQFKPRSLNHEGSCSLNGNNSNSMLLSFFLDFDWSVSKIKLFLHFDKSPCVGIFDNCLDIKVVDCVGNNELYIKL